MYLVHVVLETDAAFALAGLAHLGALVALRVVVDLVLRLRTSKNKHLVQYHASIEA